MILIFLLLRCKSDNNLVGIWSGLVNTPKGSIEVIINIEKSWFRSLSCNVSFPEQYVVEYPAKSISINNNVIDFSFSDLFNASFTGEVNGDSIVGVWSQNNTKAPLSFTKSSNHSYNHFLKTAISFCKDNAVNSSKIDWNIESSKLLTAAHSYKSIADLEFPLKHFLKILEDKHGGVSKDGKWIGYSSEKNEHLSKDFLKSSAGHRKEIFSIVLPNNSGYLRIPSSPTDKEELLAYTGKLHNRIKEFSASNCKNLILDFRLNQGGNMFSMLAGLRDLLGKGQIVKFHKPLDSSVQVISIQNDGVYNDQNNVFSFTYDSSLNKANFNIAILISPATASAAEGAIVSLKSIGNVKVFGEPSKGFTTTLQGLVLRDMIFFISTNHLSDLDDRIYAEPLNPDVLIMGGDDFNNLQNDTKVSAAIDWLNEKI